MVNRYKYIYDDQDRLISELEYHKFNPELIDITNYGYRYDGKLATVLNTQIFDDYTYIKLERLKYDKRDQVIRRDYINDEGDMSSILIEYDSINRIRKTYGLEEDRWVSSGSKSHTLKDYPQGMKFIQAVDSLDENHKVIKSINYSERNTDNEVEQVATTLFTYSNNKLTKLVRIEDGRDNYINTFTYDNNNRLIEEIRTYSDRDIPILKNQYQYDKHDQVIKLIYHDDGLEKSRPRVIKVDFKITYDIKGNWIEQKKIVDGKHLYTWVREITYWD